jgi:multidrug efflux system membrane fusion protein
VPLLLLLTACSRPQELDTDPPEVPVRLEVVRRGPFQPTLTLLGVVRPAATSEVTVPIGGRLRYPARFRDGLASGTAVAAGEVLALISTPDADLALSEARLAVAAADAELVRYERAFKAGVVPEVQVSSYRVAADLARRRLAGAEERSSRLALRSPIAGLLLADSRIPPGGEVTAGTVLARVAAGRGLRIEARAASVDLPRLHPGLTVRFVPPGAKEPLGQGVVREVSPLVDAGGTVPLVVEVSDPSGLPAPGEGVELRVELDPRDQAVTVPEDALVVTEDGSAVFRAVHRPGGATARRQTVETGARGDGRVEILRGLSPGDRVVVSGASLLTDDAHMVEVKTPEKGRSGGEQ